MRSLSSGDGLRRALVGQPLHREEQAHLGDLLVDRRLRDVGQHLERALPHLDRGDARPARRRARRTSTPPRTPPSPSSAGPPPSTPAKLTSKCSVGRRHVVDGHEVRAVEDVLGQVLHVDAHAVGRCAPRRPAASSARYGITSKRRRRARAWCQTKTRPLRSQTGHARAPARAAAVSPRRGPRRASRAVEAPAVEGTRDAVAHDAPAEAEVRAEVRAVRVEDARAAVLAAEERELAAEVVRGPHVAPREIRGRGDAVPAVGRGGEGVAGHVAARRPRQAMSSGPSLRSAMPTKPSPPLYVSSPITLPSSSIGQMTHIGVWNR